jgi:hypothetical protein
VHQVGAYSHIEWWITAEYPYEPNNIIVCYSENTIPTKAGIQSIHSVPFIVAMIVVAWISPWIGGITILIATPIILVWYLFVLALVSWGVNYSASYSPIAYECLLLVVGGVFSLILGKMNKKQNQ